MLSQEQIIAEAKQLKAEPKFIDPLLHECIYAGKDVTLDLNVFLNDWAQTASYLDPNRQPGIHLSIIDYKMMHKFTYLHFDDQDIPMVDFDDCIVCNSKMMPTTCLTDQRGKDYMTLGLCPCCGMVQQSRRPTKQWYADFYRKQWDPSRRDPSTWPKEPINNYGMINMVQGRLRPPARVLEIGTGYGTMLHPFKMAGFECYGIEAGEHRAEYVRTKLGIPVFTGEAEKAPIGEMFFQPESFDLLMSNHVLEHVYNTREVLEHLHCLLKPNGLAILGLPIHYQENFTQLTHDMSHTCSFSHANFLYLLKTIGFEYVRDFSSVDNLCIMVRKAPPINQEQKDNYMAWMKSFLPNRVLASFLEKNGLAQIPSHSKIDLNAHMKWFLNGHSEEEPFLEMKFPFLHQFSPILDQIRESIKTNQPIDLIKHLFPIRYVYKSNGVPIWYY